MIIRAKASVIALFLLLPLTFIRGAEEPPQVPKNEIQLPKYVVSSTSLFIGVHLDAVASGFTRKLKGLKISSVELDSLAYHAGLRKDDLVVTWNGRNISGQKLNFISSLRTESVDGMIRVVLAVKRKGMGSPMDITLMLKQIEGTAALHWTKP